MNTITVWGLALPGWAPYLLVFAVAGGILFALARAGRP